MFSSLSAVTSFPFFSCFRLSEAPQQSGSWVCNWTFQKGFKMAPSPASCMALFSLVSSSLLQGNCSQGCCLLRQRKMLKLEAADLHGGYRRAESSIWRKLGTYRELPQDWNTPFSSAERAAKIPKTQSKLYSKRELKSIRQVVAQMPSKPHSSCRGAQK